MKTYDVPTGAKTNLTLEEVAAYFGIGVNGLHVPIWKKANLTLEEAAAYFGIGVNKLRALTDEETCPFVLWNGSKRLIKRKAFEDYLARQYSI